MQWFDIHCHLLPGVDDGPASWDTVEMLLKKQKKDGVGRILMTPHFRKGRYEVPLPVIRDKMEKMKKIAGKYGIDVFLGCECFRSETLASLDVEEEGRRMNGSRYVLVEFSVYDSFHTIRKQVYELVMQRYIPIIAHVERYPSCRNVEFVRELSGLGAKIQLNARTVLGKNGRSGKTYSLHLIRDDLVDFIATDAHDPIYRPPDLEACVSYVKKKAGIAYVKKIFNDNPEQLLERGKREEVSI